MSSSESSDDEVEVKKRRGGKNQVKTKKGNLKKPMATKKKMDSDLSSSGSDDDEPLSSTVETKQRTGAVDKKPSLSKHEDTKPTSSSEDDDDLPLGGYTKNGNKGLSAKTKEGKVGNSVNEKTKGTNKRSGQAKKQPGKSKKTEKKFGDEDDQDDVKSDGTTEFTLRKGTVENDDHPLSSSDTSSDSESGVPLSTMKTSDVVEKKDDLTNTVQEGTKKPELKKDESSSDTSVYNSDPGNKGSPKKRKKKLSGDDEDKDKKSKRQRGEKQKSKPADAEEDPKLIKLKKCVRIAGLRCVYKQIFEHCQSDKERIKKLEEFLTDKGLKAPFTVESCKEFRQKREEQRELAELDTKNIISEGRTRGSKPRGSQNAIKMESESDESDESGASEARRECKQIFSRLKGIIDSDESD